jgi:hypothetical protein
MKSSLALNKASPVGKLDIAAQGDGELAEKCMSLDKLHDAIESSRWCEFLR